jgi:quercetin dioxygenase-like cupin family protein
MTTQGGRHASCRWLAAGLPGATQEELRGHATATSNPGRSTMNQQEVRGLVVLDGEGEQLQSPVGPAIIKVRTETTNGTITAVEVEVPPTHGPPLHRHTREDELWYLLAGHLRVQLDERLLEAPTGSLVFIPRGVPHCF